jgi:hypothetical protein
MKRKIYLEFFNECARKVDRLECAGTLCKNCILSSAYEKIAGVRLEDV